MVGGAAVTTKLMAVELAPPETVIGKLPALVKSVAEIWATSELLLMKVVGRELPFHCTIELEVKFAPNAFKLNAGPFCTPVEGEMEQISGTLPLQPGKETLRQKVTPPAALGV